ncbi:MAG TPA: OmpA family protein [Saprospiraceae bacterium]|nr:OmpA family protein [Saprospiraceae bacterium]
MRKVILYFYLLSSFALLSCNKGLKTELKAKEQQVAQLQEQVDNLQSTTGSLLDRMADLSVISKDGSESIKQSLETLSRQYGFIQDLTQKIQSKDSINMALVMNLKQSLTDINDEDIQIEIREGVVHVSISDKLLFSSGSNRLSRNATHVLGKLAHVINEHQDLNVVVEGHTDNVPMTGSCMSDNWDLSVLRATSVVRALTTQYSVPPDRLTASGRSEYVPKQDNGTTEGRSANRRTEIIIAPRLDQFFKMLEPQTVEN